MAHPPKGRLLRRSAGATRLRSDRMDRLARHLRAGKSTTTAEKLGERSVSSAEPVSAASSRQHELSWSEILRAAFDGAFPGDQPLEALLDRLERRASPR